VTPESTFASVASGDANFSWAVNFPDRAASWKEAWPLDVAAAACAREAIRAIEINYAVLECLEPPLQQAAFDLLGAVGVRVISMHTPFSEPCALEHPDRAKRLGAVDRVSRCLRFCSASSVGRLVIHSCNRTCKDAQSVRDNLFRSLDELVPVAEAAAVTLCLENMPSYHPFGSGPDDVRSILRHYEHPRLRAVFDSGHAHMAGAAVEIFDAMQPYIAHVHLHDNNGDRDLHLPPGYGSVPWPDLMPRLLQLRLDVPLFVEAAPWQGYTSFGRLQLETTALANACLGTDRFPSLRRPGSGSDWTLQRDPRTGRLLVFDALGAAI
jgi:sugar phosphate isomerase/epimerase